MTRVSESDGSRRQENLSRRLDDLERLVLKHVNWDREGRQALVVRQELQDWYEKDVAAILSQTSGVTNSANPPKNRRRIVLFSIVLIVGISSLPFADRLMEKLQSVIASPNSAPTRESPKKVQGTLWKEIAPWAEAVGIKTKNVPAASLVGRLGDKIEDKLFFERKLSNPKKLTTNIDDRARLQRCLKALYVAGDFAQTIDGDLPDLLQHEALRERVTALITQPNLDRFGFVRPQDQDRLKELIPHGTADEVKSFRELINVANQLKQHYERSDKTLYAPVREMLERGRWHRRSAGFTIDESLAELGLPTQEDAKAAKSLIGHLATPKRAEFTSFLEWHRAVKEETPFLLKYAKNPDDRDPRVEKIFYQLVSRIDEILQSEEP